MVHKSPFPRVPISNESVHERLIAAIWQHGNRDPTQKAIITANDPSKCVTFLELHKQFGRFCARKGFVIMEIWAVFHLGVMATGGVVSGASAVFTDYELERQFVDSGCSVILTDEENIDKVMKAAERCQTVKAGYILVIYLATTSSRSINLPSNVFEWTGVISCRPEYDIAKGTPFFLDPRNMGALPYSSGTTGTPKGVMLSHRNIGTMIDIFIEHFNREIFSVIGPKDHSWYNERFILNLPFYHIYGNMLLNICLLAGATIVVMAKFEPSPFLSAIQTFRPRILFTVPPILIFLAKDPIVGRFDCSSIEVAIVGAAPTGKDVCMEFLAKHKSVKHLSQGMRFSYDMTEICASHLPVLNLYDAYLGIGKTAANFEQKIIDSTGKEVAVRKHGELCVRSPTVMMGYLNRPEATAETIDKDGWFHTGDIGYLDEDGRTYIVDRLKELIKVKGFQVAPAELEDLLLSHPQIRDAAVIGIPDTRLGELVRAYVVRANAALTEESVVEFVAQKVSPYKQITGEVKFVTDIPKSPSGKILRRFLRDEASKVVGKAKM